MTTLQERFREFEEAPPPDLYGDPIWRLPAYRIGLFLSDVALEDTSRLRRLQCPDHVVDQLARAVDSISANISDGYSRYSGRERARYYEIALGSARESRDWYRRAARWLGKEEAFERASLLTRVIKILLKAVPEERGGATERRLRRKQSGGKRDADGSPSPSPSPSTSTSTSTQDQQQQ